MAKQSPVLAPRRLFVQIVELQAVFYVLGLVLISFTLLVMGLPWAAHYIFSWEDVRADVTLGWMLALLWLLDTVFSTLALVFIVGRSKLALDFALTLHGIHLAVVTAYSRRIPRSWLWWLLQGCSALLMYHVGMWASQWRELRKTFFEDYEMVDLEHDRSEQAPADSEAQ